MGRASFFLMVGLGLIACGPAQSTAILIDAQAELAAAKAARAEEHAVFEYMAAEEYLHKAREEQSYADFEVAVAFGNKALACARVARVKSEGVARATLGTAPREASKGSVCTPGPARYRPMLHPADEPNAKAEPAAQTVPKASRVVKPASGASEPADPLPEGDE